MGGHKVDHRNALLVKLAGDAEMEIRGVGEDGEIGLASGGGGQQFAVLTVDSGDVGDDFDEAHDGQAGSIDYGLDAGGA